MQRISEIPLYRSIETKVLKSSIETIDSIEKEPSSEAKLRHERADLIIDSMPDLVDSKYRPFFFKKLYTLGPELFIKLAEHARKYGTHKNGQKLFVKLLKEQCLAVQEKA